MLFFLSFLEKSVFKIIQIEEFFVWLQKVLDNNIFKHHFFTSIFDKLISSIKDSYTLMIILLQVVWFSRSQCLFTLGIFEVVSAFASEFYSLVRYLLIWVELSICRVLSVSNNLPQNEISNRKLFALDLLVVCLNYQLLIVNHSYLCIFSSFIGKVKVSS